jgi:4,5:9,10-diseco-3-hydroxy-5,9,17-trioxoandrosta-1(10),2-diene-4-oate hydrolase
LRNLVLARQVSIENTVVSRDITKLGEGASFSRRPELRKGFLMWVVAGAALALASMLFGTGLVGTVGRKARDTNYRSTVGAQQPYNVVSLGGIAIAYTDSGGSGPVLICLHAIGHGARDFADLSRRLSPGYRVLALDFPGQGNSGPDTEPASASHYADLLAQFIDHLELKSVILIGNSIGGAASIRYASTHPERVKALVLCDTGGLGKPGPISRIFIGGFVQFFAAGRRGAVWYPWAFERYYRSVLITSSAREERNRIIRSAYEIALPLEQAWRSFGRPDENLLPLLPGIQCPVLLAWAREDVVLPLKYAQPSFNLFKQHQLQVFDGGHAAFLEDPDQFEKSLRTFLEWVRERGGT